MLDGYIALAVLDAHVDEHAVARGGAVHAEPHG